MLGNAQELTDHVINFMTERVKLIDPAQWQGPKLKQLCKTQVVKAREVENGSFHMTPSEFDNYLNYTRGYNASYISIERQQRCCDLEFHITLYGQEK